MQVSEQIIQVIDALCKRFGIAIDWTQQNILPWINDLCEKIVKYELCSSVVWIVICVVLLGILFTVTKLVINSLEDYDVDTKVVIWIMFTIVLTILLARICRQVFDIVACRTFPEKILLDYIENMVSNK